MFFRYAQQATVLVRGDVPFGTADADTKQQFSGVNPTVNA